MLEETEGLDERTRQRAEFLLKQLASAFSPSNFPMTNPVVLRETLSSSGSNLVQGMANLIHDMEKSSDVLSISQTDVNAFEVGRNIATSPGKVVFQNDLMQLIQYSPSTDTVHVRPLLIVPPWINKFYILDLGPQKSFIRYMVAKGFTVFVVSWVNPDERLRDKTFEDYMKDGLLAATDAVKRETGSDKTNVIGYCVGGTLLGTDAGLPRRARRGAVLLGDILCGAGRFHQGRRSHAVHRRHPAQVAVGDDGGARLPRRLAHGHRLQHAAAEGPDLALHRQQLHAGQEADSRSICCSGTRTPTRMTPANHNFYLREFYHENKLARGQLSIGGVKLDLGKVKLPIYELCAKEDHIAPAKSVFIGSRLFGGPVTYVLAGSGHIAGVINPPGDRVKYQYWTNDKKTATLEAWIEGATEHPGSWWPHYADWLAKHSGVKVPARPPGATLGTIEDAPGSYVRTKS